MTGKRPLLIAILLSLLAFSCQGGEEEGGEAPDRFAQIAGEAPERGQPVDGTREGVAGEPGEPGAGEVAGGEAGAIGANAAEVTEEERAVDVADKVAEAAPEVTVEKVDKSAILKSLGDSGSGAEGQGNLQGILGEGSTGLKGNSDGLGHQGSGGLGLRSVGRGGGGIATRGLGSGGGGIGAGKFGAVGQGSRGFGGPAPARRPTGSNGAAQIAASRVKPEADSGGEDYKQYGVNPFVDPAKDKLSTFSIDVDTGAYTIARRKLQSGGLPPAAAVRVEEFVNFFRYNYKQPDGTLPFNVDFEAAPSPFKTDTVLLRVGVQGRALSEQERKAAHLVFLVDTSGSMQSPDKLPLAQQALHLLVNQLKPGDTVALCTYAGSVTEVLAPTGMDQRARIHQAIEDLVAGGSTAMADGLETAYKLAYKTLKPGDVNRIIILSDGDANVGQSSHEEILKRIAHYTQEGVTLSTVGFGMGNYKDTLMEQLANKGNGNYAYVDTFRQADRLFREQLGATLQVIAKDVKIQVEFNPESVESYRLLGYENRDIADKDFRNDAVDAGEIGAGHSVTAIYELKLKPGSKLDPATVRIRHKAPEAGKADESIFVFSRDLVRPRFEDASRSFRLAVAVAAFGEKLRESPHAKGWEWSRVRDVTQAAVDKSADEQELLALIERAGKLNSGL